MTRTSAAQTAPAVQRMTPYDNNTPSTPVWQRRTGAGLSALVVLLFLLDASGKLLRIEPVLKGTVELGWPVSAVVPLGVLLVIGAVLYAAPGVCAPHDLEGSV